MNARREDKMLLKTPQAKHRQNDNCLDTADKIRHFRKRFDATLKFVAQKPQKRQKLQKDEECEFKYETFEFVNKLREEQKVEQKKIHEDSKKRPKICLTAIKALDNEAKHLFEKIKENEQKKKQEMLQVLKLKEQKIKHLIASHAKTAKKTWRIFQQVQAQKQAERIRKQQEEARRLEMLKHQKKIKLQNALQSLLQKRQAAAAATLAAEAARAPAQEERKEPAPQAQNQNQAAQPVDQNQLLPFQGDLERQSVQLKDSFIKMQNFFKVNEEACNKLARPFRHRYADGSTIDYDNVKQIISATLNANTTTPPTELPENQREQIWDQQATKIVNQIVRIKQEFDSKTFQYAIYDLLIRNFLSTYYLRAIKNKDPEEQFTKLVLNFQNLFDKIHSKIPAVSIKERVLGFIISKCDLFLPKISHLDFNPQDEAQVVVSSGFELDRNGRRDDAIRTTEKLEFRAKVFFAMHYHPDYQGRAFLFLQLFAKLPHQQFQSQMIFHALEILGRAFLQTYGRKFKEFLADIKDSFIPKFRAYLADHQNGVWSEPQNKACYLGIQGAVTNEHKEETGIKLAETRTTQLYDKVQELLQQQQAHRN